MDSLAQYIQTLLPQLSAWRRDFHHFAESGWVGIFDLPRRSRRSRIAGVRLGRWAATWWMPKAVWGCRITPP